MTNVRKTGQFVISLDCEGKWGMADHLTADHHRQLTNENLLAAYRRLAALFERYDLRATFAFVGAFTQSPDEAAKTLPDLINSPSYDRWLSVFREDLEAKRFDGWFLPGALDIAAASGRHEIASHGYSHLPFDGVGVSDDVRDRELRLATDTAQKHGIQLKTMVFPRNRVTGTELLSKHGFIGYRTALPNMPGLVGRIANLAREFQIFEKAQYGSAQPPRGVIVAAPPGHFLNWKHGVRQIVPNVVTVQRWRSLIRNAGVTGGVAHLWLHPHNLITGSNQVELLEEVLAMARTELSSGRVENLTLSEYCRHRLIEAGVGAG